MGRISALILFLFFFLNLNGQKDSYKDLQIRYLKCRNEKKHDSSLMLAKQMNIWCWNTEKDTGLRYAVSFMDIGKCFDSQKQKDSAMLYFRRCREILEKQKRNTHPIYADCLNCIGVLYWELDDYKSVEPIFKRIVEIRETAQGIAHPDYAKSLNNLGVLYSEIGDYKSAKAMLRKSLDASIKSLGKDNPDFAKILNSQGALYYSMGEYDSAELFFRQAYEIKRRTLGENDFELVSANHNLGVLYKTMGDYKSAEFFLIQSKNILERTSKDASPEYANTLNSLGALYGRMGDGKMAEFYYQNALDILKRTLGGAHNDCANILYNLGDLYRKAGNHKSAESYFTEALNITKQTLGDKSPKYATILNGIGKLYFEIREYKSAEYFFKQALEIRELSLGKTHPDVSSSLSDLGVLYKAMGDYISSESYYVRALEISNKIFGEHHPNFINTENSYAFLLMQTNRELQSYGILKNNFNKEITKIALNFEWLKDFQKELYWKKESSFFDDLSWYANEIYPKVPEAVGLNYNASLASKGKILESKISSENFYRELDEIRENLAFNRRLIAKMESEGTNEQNKLKKLRVEADSLDKRLMLSWPEYATQKKNLSITWVQVQQNLNDDEAAIEFVRFKNHGDSLFHYNALVLKKGDKNPTLIQLCKEIDLKSIKPHMGFGSYYTLIWKPLESVLKDVKTIYYSPIGELNNVPFNAIYVPKGHGDEIVQIRTKKNGIVVEHKGRAITEPNAEYLIDRYSLHQVLSTRYLAIGLKEKAKVPIENSMAMFGGVNYDYLPGFTSSQKKILNKKYASQVTDSIPNKLIYLEGSFYELEQISREVKSAAWKIEILEYNEANEDNIYKLEGKNAKGVLHLATHGYSFSDINLADTLIDKKSIKYSYRYNINPMVRSGIVLAGGNWAWTGSDTLSKLGAEQNGILTALEVSQLNLKKTKLVVLSACKTGLGKIEGSEGTFGLKRGFKLAGVEQLIVSLWDVPDKETMQIMTLFYSDLTKSLDPVLSFEKSQKEMRKKYPNDPYKWAGFVLVR